ncbi:AAA family ATPase [Thiothrix nivea]|uniref:Protein CR006 P-loop domain-containing protein n=1 Tax=Thiothrix nivea (strain ATCC 35100 / DSM 5205 / JP2) TaxID=870187 RepID=A0A656HKE7_THINJ|nr:AAA family ATPase [Thiothrix nivea]EIJ36957.1 hypothetical protein Thini_4482 [Thiothrix nivea DSM 5205]
MIKNICKLKDFGIFQNHNNSNLQDFGKYNLFYGWNGSGKSTLSNVFRCIENHSLPDKFASAQFTINNEDGSVITENTINSSSLKLYTFNQDFIDENISWNNVAKSILLVDKEKIAERKKLEDLKKLQKTEIENHQKKTQKTQLLEKAISKFSSDSARHMKTSLQAIDTTDSYYLNYDKRRFESFIANNLEATKSNNHLLDDKKIIELTNAAKPNLKSNINFYPQIINNDTYIKAKDRLDSLLKTNVISQIIQRLVDHGDIKLWVETGLDLYKSHKNQQCEFCGSEITKERIKYLEDHFNDNYRTFQDRLTKADQWLLGQYIQQPQLPDENNLYDEFQDEYKKSCSGLKKSISILNAEITNWHNILKEKITDQTKTELKIESITEESITAYNLSMMTIDAVIKKHNHKSNNFQEETNKAKKHLELHYAVTEVQLFKYHEKKKELTEKTTENEKLEKNIQNRKAEIRKLEDSLSNESLGAEHFNKSLHKFLGRSELTLRFNPSKKGYEILRNNSERVEGKLSEGEKTAIAFVYFITKLKENDNKIEDIIVVVDDPVSSFDSNHLFHAYSFLRSNCNSAKQIFILTHNFTYFKLIRDWFDGVNRNRKIKNKDPNAFFFTIEASANLPRQSIIKNADASLINYNSEYHYIFSKLYKYKDDMFLSRDDSFLTANLSRKLLESFFSFKYPKHRSDISRLMSCGLKGCKITDEVTKEKIYRFINKYSHSVVIEINEDSSENLVGESHNVINDIFIWLKEVDEVHYDEMIEVISG